LTQTPPFVRALAAEAIGTAIAIGGTIGPDAMFGGPISGASMNPMRSTASSRPSRRGRSSNS
jgi:hypothetical protein